MAQATAGVSPFGSWCGENGMGASSRGPCVACVLAVKGSAGVSSSAVGAGDGRPLELRSAVCPGGAACGRVLPVDSRALPCAQVAALGGPYGRLGAAMRLPLDVRRGRRLSGPVFDCPGERAAMRGTVPPLCRLTAEANAWQA